MRAKFPALVGTLRCVLALALACCVMCELKPVPSGTNCQSVLRCHPRRASWTCQSSVLLYYYTFESRDVQSGAPHVISEGLCFFNHLVYSWLLYLFLGLAMNVVSAIISTKTYQTKSLILHGTELGSQGQYWSGVVLVENSLCDTERFSLEVTKYEWPLWYHRIGYVPLCFL